MRRYKDNEIDKLVEILKNDGVISVPTDTVYGVCACMNSKKAHDKLIEVKKRPEEKAFPVMCSNKEQISKLGIINENAKKIINAFMPGPITIILKKRKEVPDYVTNGKDTIAIRMATSKILEILIEKLESPIFLSSANQSGEDVCTNLDEIEKKCPLLDAILEGNTSYGEASTIIDCTMEDVKIIRKGPITEADIEKVLK